MLESKIGSTRERLVYIDLIRVFSCLCILTVHFNAKVSGFNGTFVYPNSIIPNFYLNGRLYLGDIGVSLFFMLSGASLMYTYKESRIFYRKRALNIYPSFWIAYILATAIDFLDNKTIGTGSLHLLLPSLAGMDGYLCTLGLIGFDFYKIGEWFLGCILLLYLVFPLLRAGFEKHPVITILFSLILHFVFAGKVNNVHFFLRIPELLFGMIVSKYRLDKKPVWLVLIGIVAFFIACLFRNSIANLTFCIAFCMFLFGLLTWLSSWIRNGKMLFKAIADLTYPAFLVHHWLITKLVKDFPLSTLSRRDVAVLFVIYVIMTMLLAKGLVICTDRICTAFKSTTKLVPQKKV